jgi:RsiW-degrading membrane proteinase PrsW (M82 family)
MSLDLGRNDGVTEMTTQATVQQKSGSLPWPLIGLIGLLLTALIFLFQLRFFFSPGLPKAGTNLLEHLYVLAWLLVATAFNRTLPLRTLVAFWFIGLYPVLSLAVLAGLPVAALFGGNSGFLADVWAPVVEEVIKALPVALYLWLVARRNRWQTAASDGLLLGFAVGAGFAFHEDALASRVSGSGWVASIWSPLLPTIEASGSLFQGAQITLGHAGWTALVGLALGLAFLYRRHRRAWLMPLVALGLVILDHGLSNYIGDLGRHSAPFMASALYALLLRGQSAVIMLLGGIVAAIVLEQRMLRWASARDRLFPAIPFSALLRELRWPLSWAGLYHVQEMTEYLRSRRAAHYTLWVWRHGGVDAERGAEMAAALTTLGLDAGLSFEQVPAQPPSPGMARA